MTNKKEKEDKLPLKARIGIYVLFYILNVVSPYEWKDDVAELEKNILGLIK